jgi:hypothetical protein
MEEADLMLKEPKFKVGWVCETGPGFISTSPARRRRQKVRILEVV